MRKKAPPEKGSGPYQYSLAACNAEVSREIAIRQNVYPKWVRSDKHKLTQDQATKKMILMETAHTYQRDLYRMIRAFLVHAWPKVADMEPAEAELVVNAIHIIEPLEPEFLQKHGISLQELERRRDETIPF